MKSRIKKKKEKRKCGFCKHFFQDEGFCKGECCKTGSNRWSTDNACLLYKLEKRRNILIMEKPLENWLTIQVSEEDVKSPYFNLVNYLEKKMQKAWLEYDRTRNHLPFNNVNEL